MIVDKFLTAVYALFNFDLYNSTVNNNQVASTVFLRIQFEIGAKSIAMKFGERDETKQAQF